MRAIVALLIVMTGASVMAAENAPPNTAPAGALTQGATRIDAQTATLKAGDLEGTVVTNANTDWHHPGYNGMARLLHKGQAQPLFIPHLAGFNFEHIFDGQDAGFSPRGGKLSLWRFGEQSVGLYRAPEDCPYGLESMTRFTLVAPNYIDVEFTAVPRKAKYASDYIGMFWASYINNPRDRAINFLGRDTDDAKSPSRWITATSPAHDDQSTHVAGFEPAVWKSVDTQKWPGLAAHFSKYQFDAPFYFGRVRNMVWVYMFDSKAISDTQTLRFSQSPTGGGDLNPAWDFHVVVRSYKVDQPFSWRARCIYKPYVSAADVLKEYLTWSGRKDLQTPAKEPEHGEMLPPSSVNVTVKSIGQAIRVDKTGFQWFKLATPLKKDKGESVGVWFSAGKSGGANRYGNKRTHWVYWAVDIKEPKAGQELGMGRYGYPIFTGYRTAAGVEKLRTEEGGGEDGTSTGLAYDPLLQESAPGEVNAFYWYGYEGQTLMPVILSAPAKEQPEQE